jgi:HNH endonuclease
MQYIQLTKGYIAAVDDEDLDVINIHKWHALDSQLPVIYAARWIPGLKPRKALRMHHAILGISSKELKEDNLVVDHIDRDGLNNQKKNLRIVTRTINSINSERCDNAKGIYYDCNRHRYKAFLLNPKVYVGTYRTETEAQQALTQFKLEHGYENN